MAIPRLAAQFIGISVKPTIILLIAIFFTASCGGGGTPATVTPELEPTSFSNNPAAMAAMQELALELSVPLESVSVVSGETIRWTNSCLEIPREGETCAAVVTPGYAFVLEVSGQKFRAQTDESGDNVRIVNPSVDRIAGALNAREVLAVQLHLNYGAITIESATPVLWKDECFEVPLTGQTCPAVEVAGFRVLLEALTNRYEYRTNLPGDRVTLASAPQPSIGRIAITLHREEPNCLDAQISPGGVAFGDCGGPQIQGLFAGGGRISELASFTAAYQSFTIDTAAGSIEFTGTGRKTAEPSVQRSIAEWAALVVDEAVSGKSDAARGLAIGWHREGGVNGACDDLAVYRSGEVIADSCMDGNARSIGKTRLDADRVAVNLVFPGSGSQEMDDATKQNLLDFAAGIFAVMSK
jgi:hypothetical protein